MKFVIWGTGIRGKSVFRFLGEDRVCAFIDSNTDIQGDYLFDKPIISYDEYRIKYDSYFIIVSMRYSQSVVQFLEEDGVYGFFVLSEAPCECYGFGDREILKKLPFEFDNNLPSVIWGINLFSVLLMEECLNRGLSEVYIVPHDGMPYGRREKIQAVFPERYRDGLENNYRANVYVTVDANRTVYGSLDNCIYNAFDFSHQLPDYYNQKIVKYRNCHCNKRCFIVATGPSLLVKDLDKLYQNNEYSFSMNKIYYSFENTKWRPDYYVVEDKLVLEQNADAINSLEIDNMFIADVIDFSFKDDICRFHLAMQDYEWTEQKFSSDMAWGTFWGGTVTYACIQFAMYMGFKEIYLLGTDFTFGKMGSQGNHFYQQEDKKNNTFDRNVCLRAYETAKKYADTNGIKIYNATRGGALEVFERVNFDSLFE